jgi:HSP20 family protein
LTGLNPCFADCASLKLSIKEGHMGAITRYNPFEDFFQDFGKGFFVRPVGFPAETELAMKIDVKEDDKRYTVKAEIPGVKKEDIQIEIDNDQVSLRAEVKREKEEKKDEKIVYSERSYGMVSRSFTLPAAVETSDAQAEYKDGVLTLTLRKKANGNGKRISVM